MISPPVRIFPPGGVPRPKNGPVVTDVESLFRPAGIVRWPAWGTSRVATAFVILLLLHGSIHLLGAAKAFGWANLSQLTQPISHTQGVLWLLSALLFTVTATALFVWPRGWWLIGAGAIAVSMLAIVPSWADAKIGGGVNGIVAIGLVFGVLSQGPSSLRAEYEADVARYLSDATPASPVTDADLAHLPPSVQKYLRLAGVVGQPRVASFRVRMHGRIREGPQRRWMPLRAEQYNAVRPAARLFYLTAAMFAIPVQGYHRYVGSSASMRVKAAALVTVAAADGREMTQGETVTLFNDMCVLAPATLIDRAIEWHPLDARTTRARFTNGGYTISAELSFNDDGELVDFASEDRYQAQPDGTLMRRLPWSTPVGRYRSFGSVRLPSEGQGRWHDPEGEYAYIELTIDDVQYNTAPR